MDKPVEVISVNISRQKGTVKLPVDRIELTPTGISGDAHAGHWHRQVSMLASESILTAAEKAGTSFPWGTFAENITTRGLLLHKTNILDRFVSPQTILEVTQIGKKCHSQCEIGRQIGNCIMPLEGIFCRVVQKGSLTPGDRFLYQPFIFRVKLITLSDRASAGIYQDRSGPEMKSILEKHFLAENRQFTIDNTIIPDRKEKLENLVLDSVAKGYHAIFTTGSTGVGPRDIAPETLFPLFDKEIPGIMDLIRLKYGEINRNALISRSVAGVRKQTMIFALPGSVKAVREYMEEITPLLEHLLRMIHNIDNH